MLAGATSLTIDSSLSPRATGQGFTRPSLGRPLPTSDSSPDYRPRACGCSAMGSKTLRQSITGGTEVVLVQVWAGASDLGGKDASRMS